MPDLPGRSIPYALTEAEVADFIGRHSYIGSIPPWGVIVNENYGQFLVWYDAVQRLHVIDVTNLPIAQRVNDARFVSPDSSVVDNVIDEVRRLVASVEAGTSVVLALLPFVAVGWLLFEVHRVRS